METYYVETDSVDPYYNLAFEEYLLTHRTDGNIVMLWQNDNAVVVGLNQNAAAEINADFVSAHDIRVVRRTTGGGAVYHDLGNLNYSFITDGGKEKLRSLSDFSAPVIAALKTLGVTAEVSGRNDITVNGRKISGTAQRIFGGRILHHGTLLFSANVQMIEGALNADKAKFEGKRAQSVAARVGNIADNLDDGVTIYDFWKELRAQFSAQARPLVLTDEERTEINKLADTKYRTWEWNFGKSPKFALTGKKRFSAGTLEAHIDVGYGGIITGAEFIGDYMAKLPCDALCAALTGARFSKEAVAQIFNAYDIAAIFGGITAAEILSVIFG